MVALKVDCGPPIMGSRLFKVSAILVQGSKAIQTDYLRYKTGNREKVVSKAGSLTVKPIVEGELVANK